MSMRIAFVFLLLSPLPALGQIPDLPVDDPDSVGAIDQQRAYSLFGMFRAQEDLAFHSPNDGCYARCHLMSMRLGQMGVPARRLWAFSAIKARLYAKTNGASSRVVEWDWHVAPVVPVRVGDKTRWLVFDPCLFSRPVSVEDWAAALRKNAAAPPPQLTVTQLGEPPIRNGQRFPGSGYWLRPDPREGPSAHAFKTLGEMKAPK